jgi:HEAT repeat protein
MQIFGPKKTGINGGPNTLANGQKNVLEEGLDHGRYQQMRDMFAKHENTSLILTFTKDDESLPYIEKLLSDQNDDVRKTAAHALTVGYSERGMWEKVSLLLAHPLPSIKANSIKALKDKAESEDISPILASLAGPLVDADEGVRMVSAEALVNAALNPQSRASAIGVLTSALSNKEDGIKMLACESLEEIASRKTVDGAGAECVIDLSTAVPSLGNTLVDPCGPVRKAAANSLVTCAQNPNPIIRNSAVTMLLNALSYKDPAVQLDSTEALAEAALRGVDISLSVPTLGNLAQNSGKKDEIRVAATKALMHFSEKGSHVASALDALAVALSDKNPQVRTFAERALGFSVIHKDTSERAISVLGNTLSVSKRHTRHHATLALWNALTNESTRAKGLDVFRNVLDSEGPRRDDTKIDATKGLADAAEKGVLLLEVLPSLGRMLHSRNPEIRKNAADALVFASMKQETMDICLELLSNGLSSQDKAVKITSSGAIADAAERGVDISSLIPKAAQSLSDESKEVRRNCSRALGYAAHNKANLSEVMEPVSRAMLAKDDSLRRNSVWTALNFAENKGDISLAIGNLGLSLYDADETIRLYSAKALVAAMRNPATREKALSVLVSGMAGKKERGREMASWALIYASEERLDLLMAVGALGKGLSDRDPVVKCNSASALLKMAMTGRDISDAIGPLGKALAHKDEAARLLCAKALMAAAMNGTDVRNAGDSLRGAITDPSPEVGWCALEALKTLKPERASLPPASQ